MVHESIIINIHLCELCEFQCVSEYDFDTLTKTTPMVNTDDE
jgi:hypothetical protein